MARLRAVFAALWTAVRRDGKSLESFAGNNLFLASMVFLFLNDPGAFASLNAIIVVVLFFPLSADPLRKIPRARLAIWPLSARDRWLLRVLSPWLNPLTWLLAILALWRGLTVGLWALLAGLFAFGFVAPWLAGGGGSAWGAPLPNVPGRLSQLVRKNLRQMLGTLDFYAALLWSAAGLVFRAAGLLPREALLPLTLLVMLSLSTYAQTLFGLDGEGGLTRYRLLPVAGWQVLAAKDAAFLLAALLLTAPLDPLGGLAAALVVLALGHHASVMRRREIARWRFATGASFGSSMMQVVLMVLAAAGTVSFSPLLLVPCVAAYAGSTWWFGRELERRPL